MSNGKLYLFFFIILSLFTIVSVFVSHAKPEEVLISEKLGNFVPLDLSFYDEQGKSVKLEQLINKPTILSLGYYKCTELCTPLLNNIVDLLKLLPAKPIEEYNVLSVSFDEAETFLIASDKKQNFLKQLSPSYPPSAWKFLTGNKENITKLTNSVGFKFKKTEKGFMHTVSLIILSPDGKIIRYIYGMRFLPFDVKMALVEALEGRSSPTINKVLRYCFSYDPKGRRYALNITRIGGAVILSVSIFFVIYLLRS